MRRKPEKIIIDNIENCGKLPPQANDLEITVLGSIMLEQPAFNRISIILTANDFYNESHKIIFKSFEQLAAKNKPIDLMTVIEQIRENNELEICGGPLYISQLTNHVSSTANLEYHSTIVKQKSDHRRFIQLLSETQIKAWDGQTDIYDLIKSSQSDIDNLVLGKNNTDLIHVGKTAIKVYEETEKLKNNPQETIGLKSFSKEINKKLMGYAAPDLIVVAARPGEGKSTFALEEALNIAENNEPVLFFSLEMKDKQLLYKILSQKANIEVLRIRSGHISENELTEIAYHSQNLQTTPLYFADGINQLQDIKSISRRSVKNNGIKFIVIDYLGLISHEIQGANREQIVSDISKQLKQLAIELNVPIMLLSQLSRPTKGVTIKPPTLFDLKESGGTESNADVVLFIFRPEYWGISNVSGWDEIFNERMALLDVAKQRLGNTGQFLIGWNGQFSRFENYLPYEVFTETTNVF
jgi:replicative DNA helicase